MAAGAIRVSALTPSYLCGVLPNMRECLAHGSLALPDSPALPSPALPQALAGH